MSSERGQTLWPSDDLWANIFSITKTKPTPADGLQNLHPTRATRVSRHQEFREMRVVCKGFQRIFEEHVDLSSCLLLDESNIIERLPSALQWLQRCHNSVEHAIMACGTSVADVILQAVVSPEAKLSTAVLCILSRSAILVLSTFTSLTFCELIAPRDRRLDVGPLHALSGLSILHLKAGVFSGVGHLAHLSSLQLWEAVAYVQVDQLAPKVTVTPVPLEALQKLSLTESKLLGLAHGMSTFTSLQSLKCHGSMTKANNISDCMFTMANHFTHLPSNLAVLTSLTRVCVVIRSRVCGTFQLHWVQAIPGLEHLNLSFLSKCHVEFDEGFACLSKLKTLSVSRSEPGNNNMNCTVALMTPWESMLSLKEFRLSAREVYFGENILGLSKLPRMKCLFLEVQGVMDCATSKWLAALTKVMATKRPQVVYVWE